MELKTYLSQERGRQASLAKALSVHAPDLSRWADGSRPIPIQYAAQIEKETGGAVTRKEMFPNDWQRIWPELAQQLTPEDIAEAEAKRNGGIRMSGDTRDAKNIGE